MLNVRTIAIVVFFFAQTTAGLSSDAFIFSNASEIAVIGVPAQFMEHRDYWITCISGPVGNIKGRSIRIGQVIRVKDRTIVVHHIQVTRALRDLQYGGEVFAHRGQVSCTAFDSPNDLPNDNKCAARWIYIKNCKVNH